MMHRVPLVKSNNGQKTSGELDTGLKNLWSKVPYSQRGSGQRIHRYKIQLISRLITLSLMSTLVLSLMLPMILSLMLFLKLLLLSMLFLFIRTVHQLDKKGFC